MIKYLLLIFLFIFAFKAQGQFESTNNFGSPQRTIHWVTGTAPPGAVPIWITKGQNFYGFYTDTINFDHHKSVDETMTNKLLWIKTNGDLSCWTPNYLRGTDTISLSNRINAKLSTSDTTFFS